MNFNYNDYMSLYSKGRTSLNITPNKVKVRRPLMTEKLISHTKISIFTLFTSISIFIDIEKVFNLSTTLNLGIFKILLIAPPTFIIYKKYYQKKHKNYLFSALASIFSVFILIGHSYNKTNSWNLIFGSIPIFILAVIRFIGFYLIFKLLIDIGFKLSNHKLFKSNNKNALFNFIFNKHPFLISIAIIIISWLPYIISFYPAILSPDPSNQIKQFFGIKTHYNDSVIMKSDSILITNHHPVAHTVLLGSCLKIGRTLISDNFGLFIYSIIQISILASTLAFTIKYIKKLNTPLWFRIITLSIYALVPIFPLYAMSAVKDTIFSSFIIIYTLFIFDFIKNHNLTFKKGILTSLLILLIMLFRNNGYHVIILSAPFIILSHKKSILKSLIIFLLPILFYNGYTKILLPTLNITEGSIREVLSIPFQQTARYIKYYEKELTKPEQETVDKILDLSDIKKRYNPTFADTVKNKFNKMTTNDDLRKYFKFWFKGLLKHPNVYIESTLNNTFGYYYPNTHNWYIYYKYDTRLKKAGFNYRYNNLDKTRKVLSNYGIAFPYIPLLGFIVNIGFNTWLILLMFTYLLALKKYKYINYLLPSLLLILVCIASPVNTYFRYALPFIFTMPLMLALFINIRNETEDYT